MKIAILSDSHWGVKNDNQVVQDYLAQFYTGIFFPELERRGIKTIWHGGDIFDRRKFINFLTLQKATESFLSQIGKRGMEMHVILGNHDCYFKNTNEVNSVAQLLRGMKGIHVYEEPTEVQFDSLKVMFLPWLNDQNNEAFMKKIKASTAQYLLAHLELAGHTMHPGQLCDHGMDSKLFSSFDTVLTGHFHTRSFKNGIQYLGAPYEMTWIDYNDPKGFHILDTETRELEFVDNAVSDMYSHAMFFKVLYNDEKNPITGAVGDLSIFKNRMVKLIVEKKTNHALFDQVIDEINRSGPLNLTIVEDMTLDVKESEDAMKDAQKDTLTLINEYVDDIQSDIETQPLKDILKNLYNEAVQ